MAETPPPPPRPETPSSVQPASNQDPRPTTPLSLTNVPSTSCSTSQSSQQQPHQSPSQQQSQHQEPQSPSHQRHPQQLNQITATNTSNNSATANIVPSATSSNGQSNSQQFCLRWNNYQTNLTSVFDQLLQNESFVDVTLACDGHSIKAHKMVLSACSPYFQALFFDNPCQHPIIIMRDVKWPELKAAVEFMYKGEINVSQDQIGPLLRVAEMLKIRGLADVTGDQDLNASTASVAPISTTAHRTPVLPPQISATKKPRLTPKDWEQMDGSRTNNSGNNSNSGSINIGSISGGNNNNTSILGSGSSGSNIDDIPIETRHRKRRWPSIETSDVGSPMHTPTPDHIDAQSPIPPNNNSSSSNNNNNTNTNNNNNTPPGPSSSVLSHPPSTSTPIPPPFPIPPPLEAMGLSSLVMSHPDDMEIKPGIAEMIREEERAKLMENSHAWLGAQTSASIAGKSDSYQYQLQSMWQKCWNTNQNLIHHLRFRERGPLKSWRPETMAEAIFSVLKDGLSLSQAARKYDIPYPTFVLYANRVHNMLGPSIDGGTDLRPKGRGRPQRILLGIWPDEHIKGVIKTVVFRDAKEFKDEPMHLAYGRHSPVYPFPEGQLGFPGQPCANGLGSQTPVSGAESLSPEAAAAVAAVVGLRQQMQMAAAAQHDGSYNLPAHCANIHGNNGGSAGSIPMPKLGSPAASGQMGNSGGTSVPMPRLASPAIPGMSNNPAHSLSGLSGLHIMQGMMAGVQPSQLTVSPASNGGSHSTSSSSSSAHHHSSSHTNPLGHHITSTTTVNSGSLNISRISSPASSAHDLRMNSPDDHQMHSPLDMQMESAGMNLAIGVSGMSYKSSRGAYSPPRSEHLFQDEINDFVSAAQRSCPSRLSNFKEPAGGIKIEPMTECRGE